MCVSEYVCVRICLSECVCQNVYVRMCMSWYVYQVVIISASSVEQLCKQLNALQLLPKLTNSVMEELDRWGAG